MRKLIFAAFMMFVFLALAGPLPAGAAWQPPEIVHTGPSVDVPQIAFDGSGTAIAVWEGYVAPDKRIYASRWDGTAWDTAEIIDAGAGNDARHPQITLDGAGNAIAVWRQSDGSNERIYANRWDGATWGGAVIIDDGGGDEFPQIASDGSGNAIAVWRHWDSPNEFIHANRWDDSSSSWSGVVTVHSGSFSHHDFQVAFDGSGNAIVVWRWWDGSSERIYANRWDGTTWGTAEIIDADTGNNAQDPQITLDGSGNAIAVWRQSDGSNERIYANRWNGVEWGTAEIIDADTGNNAQEPQIALDGSGYAIAVWRQGSGSSWRIYANHWNGADWATAEIIDAGESNKRGPQITLDGSGNALAVWPHWDGSNWRIYANRWDGTAWDDADIIDAGIGDNADEPQIASDGSGNAIGVWRISGHIYAALYSPPPFSGGEGTAADPWQIATAAELDKIRDYLGSDHADKHFVLIADLDLADYRSGEGWAPIGTNGNEFTGTFDGGGQVIRNLVINRSVTNEIGLFGSTKGAVIKNVGLVDVDVKGNWNVGGLVGSEWQGDDGGSLTKVYVTGTVVGAGGQVGGLAGYYEGTIADAYSTADVAGTDYVGGLVGMHAARGQINNSYATGAVHGGNQVGGLVGEAYRLISESYATGSVVGSGDKVGGLVGHAYGSIEASYATGSVAGVNEVGGLIGFLRGNDTAAISNIYATGVVTASSHYVGGLVGEATETTITNAYAVGMVSGTGSVGGLVGQSWRLDVITSYYNSETTGQSDTGMGEPRTTAELKLLATFGADWDIVGDQALDPDYPFLAWQGAEDYPDEPVWVIGTRVASHTVTPSAGAGGSISPSSPQPVNPGATVSFTVTPEAGYTAQVGGSCGGSLAGSTFTTDIISADCTVEARFVVALAIQDGSGNPFSGEPVTRAVGESLDFQVVGAENPTLVLRRNGEEIAREGRLLEGDNGHYELLFTGSGLHEVEVSAGGETRTLTIAIYPHLAFVSPRQGIPAAAQAAEVLVFLDGPAPYYPVTVPYSVSGAADLLPLALREGTLEIAAAGINGSDGLTAGLTLEFTESPASSRELVFQLGEPENALIGRRASHTLRLEIQPLAPLVDLNLYQQMDSEVLPVAAVVQPERGLVEVRAQVSNLSSGALTFDWSASDYRLVNQAATEDLLVFDPAALVPDHYLVELRVTEAVLGLSATATLVVQVLANCPAESAADGCGVRDSGGQRIPDQSALPGGQAHRLLLVEAGQEVAETAAGLRLRPGRIARAANRTGLQVTLDEIAAHAGLGGGAAPQAVDYAYDNFGGYFDFEVAGLTAAGQTVTVVLPLAADIPSGAVYRKYSPERGWFTFVEDEFNRLWSAARLADAACPPLGSSLYGPGLVAGNDCLLLEIAEGGPNDFDLSPNGIASDPGGLALAGDGPAPPPVDDPSGPLPAGGSSGCFIATAAYGSPLASQVMVLRDFRDRYLLTNGVGRWLVARYYHYSPPLAEGLAQSDTLRRLVRWGLTPLVLACQYPLMALLLLGLGGGGLVALAGRNARSGPVARRLA